VVLSAAFLLYGYWEAGQLRVVERELFFEGLPPAFDGFRIIHLTDLHTSGFGRVERKLRRLLRETPADLLVVTGDFKGHLFTPDELVHASLDRIFESVSYPWGFVAIPGNHDTTSLCYGLADRGRFTCLLRTSLLLEWQGQRLLLLGLATTRPNDGGRGEHEIYEATWVGGVTVRGAPWGLLPDTPARPRICDELADGKAFRVLLAHTPDAIEAAKAAGIDLVLAGDTHGGQVWLPFNAVLLFKPRLIRTHARGHFTEGRTQMYVSPGVGTLGIGIRFLCPPEVSVLTLRRARDASR
jgi:hypothetical protein